MFRRLLTALAAIIALAVLAHAAAPIPRVRIVTDLGTVEAELYPDRAPRTVANFLRYVDASHYTAGLFHRTVTTTPDNQPDKSIKIDVIQAGVNPAISAQFPAIPLERTRDTGLRHLDGTLSMARDGPDTATSDFFICVGAQPELDFDGRRNPDRQGFAAFGRVTSGMDVVRRIHAAPADGQNLTSPVRILRIERIPASGAS